MEEAQPRSKLSIWLISLILGPIVLMLWLGRGRGRLAFLYLLAQLIFFGLVFLAIGTGLIASPAFADLDVMMFLLTTPIYVVGLVQGLKIRQLPPSRPWFSRWYAAILLPIAAGWIVSFGIRELLFHPYNLPSGSMIPSLMVGDHVFASKMAYGYSRHSFTFGPEFSGRIWGAEPKRGDILVFKLPRDNQTDYVKRLIGLPGEHIQIRDGVVYINGVAVPKQRVADYVDEKGEGFGRPIPQYVETLPNGVTYRVLDSAPNGVVDNTDEYVVPEGHFFMMGDNRDNALDSRFAPDALGGGVGFVPYENLIGPIVFVYWNSLGIRIDDRL